MDIAGPITITGSILGSSQISSSKLAPGHSVTRYDQYCVTPLDIDVGFVINSAYAKGSFNNTTVTSNSDTARVTFFGPNQYLYSRLV